VVDFRYAQFCPLTRAVEILGERWTILILRELFLGPKRFSDLKSALNGVSPSVLADRLARLEERNIVSRRELPPPAASIVYELDEAGRALRPLLAEMTRWGVRFMGAPDPADSFRPEWLLLGLQVFARTRSIDPANARVPTDALRAQPPTDALRAQLPTDALRAHLPTDALRAHLHIEGGVDSVDIFVTAGPGGTVVSRTPLSCDVRISAPPMDMLMFASGLLMPGEPGTPQTFRFEGDIDVVRRIPALFDFSPTPAVHEDATSPTPDVIVSPATGEARRKNAARSGRTPTARRSRQGATRP